MTTPAPELSPGTVIDGYTLGAKIRARSGAATYAAKNGSGADVHLTAYADACFPSALVRERSLRELRQLQSIDDPSVARVLDCGKLGESGIYEVGEVLVGEPVTHAGPLSQVEVGNTMNAIGNALMAAQKVGVIHRNLGGEVVFKTPQGLKVSGFAVGEPQAGGAFGAIDTIAPEQVTGKVVDQRTLIYNLAALAHQLLTGQPLFAGTPEQKLDLHANREAPAVDPVLKRALSKDPRMRPMMLKQFITELAKLAGEPAAAAAPAAPKPSTRGWTMFMEAAEADVGAAPAAAAPAPSPAAVAPAPSAPAPSAPAPSAPMSVPAPSAPAPAPAAAKPSTRGWTMFMDAEEPSAAMGASEAAVPAPAPAPAPMPAPMPAQAAAPEPAAAKPSTRGWTMFMDAEEPAAPAAAAPAPVAPAPVAPAPAAVAPVPAPAPAPLPAVTPEPVAAPTPSTRGWTMFMDGEEAAPAAAAPAPAPTTPAAPAPVSVAPSPSAPAAEAPVAAAPSTRGWTMFMDAETPAAPEPEPTPEPAATAPVGTSNAPSTRGWTMFMEAQVPGEPPPADEPEPQPEPEAGPPSAQMGASDSKGWTVFMERQPILPPEPVAPATPAATPAPVEPAAGRTVMMDQAPSFRQPEPSHPVAASVPANPAVEAQRPPQQQPATTPPSAVAVPEAKSKVPMYAAIGVVVIILIVLAVVFGT